MVQPLGKQQRSVRLVGYDLSFNGLFTILVILNLLDVSLTIYGLQFNSQELNPVANYLISISPFLLIPYKGLGLAFVYWVVSRHKENSVVLRLLKFYCIFYFFVVSLVLYTAIYYSFLV